MPRRGQISKRIVVPDAKYQSETVTRFTNKVMERGKKATAVKIMYDALEKIEGQEKKPGAAVLEQAVKNATPLLQVKARRVGGATYQVPVEVPPDRGLTLAIRWLLASAKARPGKTMAEKLAGDL